MNNGISKGRTRTNAALVNVSAGLCYQFINIIGNMILPPLLISTFGSAINGLVAAIRQILSYAQLFGSGISAASMQALYEPLNKNDTLTVNRMLVAVERTFRKAGFLFSVSVFLSAGIYPFFVNSQPFYITAILTIILGVAGVSEFFFIGRFRTLLGADQRSYVVSIAQSVGTILSVSTSVILLFLTKNIIFVQLGGTLTYLIRIIIPAMYIKKNYVYIDTSVEPDMSALKKRKDVVVHSLMGSITLNSQTVILSMLDRLEQASVYAVYNLVFYGLYSLLSSLVNTLTASIGSLILSSTEERIKEFYNTYIFIFYQLMFTIYATASILIIPFIKLYISDINDANYQDSLVALMFVIIAFFNAIRIPAVTIINATGHFKETKRGSVIEALLSITIQLLTVKKFGIYGILMGGVIALAFRSNELIIYSCKYILKVSPWKTYKKITMNVTISSSLFYFFKQILPEIQSWFQWVSIALAVFFINFIIILFINYIFDRKAGLNAIDYVMKVIKRK